jgi:transcription termination/antitermination protein NusG
MRFCSIKHSYSLQFAHVTMISDELLNTEDETSADAPESIDQAGTPSEKTATESIVSGEAVVVADVAEPAIKIAIKQEKSEILEEKKWFCLRVISGKEKSIKERIDREVVTSEWGDIVFNVIVPTEKVYKVVNGKKVLKERNLLPGYILVEAISSKLNGDVAKSISDITNVIHFLGKETPLPMTQVEANRLLGIVDDSAEAGERMVEPYLVGETVKIIDGAFADFVGEVKEVNLDKKKLKVVVKIFGRGTEMDLTFMQVEKIS